jgi:hypothetical protein
LYNYAACTSGSSASYDLLVTVAHLAHRDIANHLGERDRIAGALKTLAHHRSLRALPLPAGSRWRRSVHQRRWGEQEAAARQLGQPATMPGQQRFQALLTVFLQARRGCTRPLPTMLVQIALRDNPRQEDLERHGEVLRRLELILGYARSGKDPGMPISDLTDPPLVRHPINDKFSTTKEQPLWA